MLRGPVPRTFLSMLGGGGEGGLVRSLWGWRAAQPSCSQEHCVKGAGTEGRGGSSAFTPWGRRGRGLTNTRKHNLKVLRAGPKSTVSWERGHRRGTPGVLGVRRLVSNGLPHQGLASSPPPFVFGQRLGPFRWSHTLGNK